MMNSLNRIYLTIFCFICLSGSAFAQQSTLPDRFDLVIFGNYLEAQTTDTWLKNNPGIENKWTKLTDGEYVESTDKAYGILIYKNLSTEDFAGQDIRENYIAFKIAGGGNARLRAVYALPTLNAKSDNFADKLLAAIQKYPEQLKQFSIASQVRPRPVDLSDDTEFVEHIEMPVRHIKPGINEVKWLNIIFSSE